jgi:tetratricopeptide (TPR) repeat protein
MNAWVRGGAFASLLVGAVSLGSLGCGAASHATSSPKTPSGPLERAEAALQAHDCATARVEARRAMANAKIARALIVLGACAEIAGDVDEAVTRYEEALSVDPAARDASTRLASLLIDLGRPEEAIDVARRALVHAPFDPDLWVVIAIGWERKGDEDRSHDAFVRAVAAFRAGLKEHEGDARYRLRFARACIAVGDIDEAKAQLDEVIDLAGDDTDVLAEAALAYSAAGNPGRCIDALDDAIDHAIDPAIDHAIDPAIDHANGKTREWARRRAVLLADRAACKYATKDLDGARDDADASLALDPNVTLHLEAARWDEQAGDKRGCAAHYVAAAKLSAGTPLAKEAELGARRCSS